ncbi:MAG: methyltransferase family protein [Longimicrobiales bacterium]
MNPQTPVLLLCALNLALIAALPRLFFRPGRLGVAWTATASPIGLAGAGVLGVLFGVLEPFAMDDVVTRLGALAAVPLAAASIALIALTLGSHARPVSLWHQRDDTPELLVTHGAYARVRHPFYAAFLLALCACALAAPHVATLLALAGGATALTLTARREERRLLASPHGDAYRAYMLRTGRFLPRQRADALALRRPARAASEPRPHSRTENIMRSVLLTLLGLLAVTPVAAQTLLHPDPDLPSLRLELMHPDLEGEEEIDLDDFAGFLTLNAGVSDRAVLVVDLPFAHSSFLDESSSGIGNPYVGLLFGAPARDVRFELGARLPIGQEEFSLLLGQFSDIQRLEAFIPDLAAAYAAVDWRNPLEDERLRLRLRGGPTLWLFTGGDESDAEMLIDYLGQLWYVSGPARLGGGLSGRFIATGDEGDFGERSIHQLDLAGGYDFGVLEPGLQIRVPFDAFQEISSVIGVWVEVEF